MEDDNDDTEDCRKRPYKSEDIVCLSTYGILVVIELAFQISR
jgi:hypothetical protein